MIKACIFDLDGTLLQTLPTITYYINKSLQKYSLSGITVEQCRGIVGNGARLICERAAKLVGLPGEKLGEFLADYSVSYDGDPSYLTEPFDGILPLLAELKRRDLPVLVFSNKPDSATAPLVRKIFGDLVTDVRGAREGVPLKPAPDACLEMLAALGLSPAECFYIGDSGVDMQTGKNLGAALTVGVTWGFRDREEILAAGADRLIDTPQDLLPLL